MLRRDDILWSHDSNGIKREKTPSTILHVDATFASADGDISAIYAYRMYHHLIASAAVSMLYDDGVMVDMEVRNIHGLYFPSSNCFSQGHEGVRPRFLHANTGAS